MITDLSENFNKYVQYKHLSKLFDVGGEYHHTVITLYRLERNEKLPESFAVKTAHFMDRK